MIILGGWQPLATTTRAFAIHESPFRFGDSIQIAVVVVVVVVVVAVVVVVV